MVISEDTGNSPSRRGFNVDSRRFKTPYHRPRWGGTPPCKTSLLAAFLLTVGILFTISGLVVWWQWGLYEAIPFWSLGGLTIIPGLYASVIIFRAWMGHKGFTYDQIPSYDDGY